MNGIKFPFVKQGFQNKETIEAFIQKAHPQCFKVLIQEELDEENILYIVDKTEPLQDVAYIKPNLQEVVAEHHIITQQNQLMELLLRLEEFCVMATKLFCVKP